MTTVSDNIEYIDASSHKVTVAIVCFDENEQIIASLKSLFSEKNLQQIGQLIVIDNGDGYTSSCAANYISSIDREVNLLIVQNSENNIGLARALAVEMSEHDLIVFFDSDCLVPENWIESLDRNYQRQKSVNINACGVCGPNRLPETTSFSKCINQMNESIFGHGFSPQAWKPNEAKKVDHLPTTNCLLEVQSIKEVGNFSPKYRRTGEDYELGTRLSRFGYACYLCPGPLVLNGNSIDLKSWANRMYRFSCARFVTNLKWGGLSFISFLFYILLFVLIYSAFFMNIYISIFVGFTLYSIFLSFIVLNHRFSSTINVPSLFCCYFVTHISYFLGAIRGHFALK